MALVLSEVVKDYASVRAVDRVSFAVDSGSVCGLIGPNGAGKSTTMRMICDIIQPDSGSITWKGSPVADLPRSCIGYLPEERGLYEAMPVAEQIEFFAEIRGLQRAEARQRTRLWMARLGLEEYAAQPLRELSKGNQQKVQLAVAVVHGPELLILDEPFSGLDPVNHDVLTGAVAQLREGGTTLLLSTHDMEQVEASCDTVAMIDRSRLALAGSISEVRARHSDTGRITLSFSGDVQGLAARVAGLEVVDDTGAWAELSVDASVRPDELLALAVRYGRVNQLRVAQPTMRAIFIEEVHRAHGPA